jgi:hypothetical protein
MFLWSLYKKHNAFLVLLVFFGFCLFMGYQHHIELTKKETPVYVIPKLHDMEIPSLKMHDYQLVELKEINDGKPLNLFTPLNINATNGYIIEGATSVRIMHSGSMLFDTPPIRSRLTMDPQNNRLRIDHGEHKSFIITSDAAYFFRNEQYVDSCMRFNGWNYTMEINRYAVLLSLPKSTEKISYFQGYVKGSVFSCYRSHDSYNVRYKGILLHATMNIHGQELNVNDQMIQETNYELSTLDFNSTRRDEMFVLPKDCLSTQRDYCSETAR